jgi:hypothetical protein
VDRETLKAVVDLIFDTAEEYFRGRPLIVAILNMAQTVVVNTLLDRIMSRLPPGAKG